MRAGTRRTCVSFLPIGTEIYMAQVRITLPDDLHRHLRVLRAESRRNLSDLIAAAVLLLLRSCGRVGDAPATADRSVENAADDEGIDS